jgi:hypothetical protein
MVIEFSPTGSVKTNPLKINSFVFDQMKQNGFLSIIFDGIQLFFCLCYTFRLVKVKLPLYFKTVENKRGDKIEYEIEGYQKNISIFVDILVIIIFLLKFTFTLETNFNDVEGLIDDNYLGNN